MSAPRSMLLDTAALYFRAFYGVPDTVRALDGTPVNAVRGLLDMIARLVTDFEIDELIACWDDDWRPPWRVALIPTYKAHRVERVEGGRDIEITPPELVVQVPIIREVLTALGIPIVGAPGYEADDVIGTLAATRSSVDVVTGDRDLFQLIDDDRDVRVIYTARGMSRLEIVTDAVLRTKYGVAARQYADFAAMRGDSSDGLPGVAGVGEKTAASLLAEFGTLDAIVAAAASGGVSASLSAKFAAASGYLESAPAVVAVVRDLELPAVDAGIGIADRDAADDLGQRWSLGDSLVRCVRALDARRPPG